LNAGWFLAQMIGNFKGKGWVGWMEELEDSDYAFLIYA